MFPLKIGGVALGTTLAAVVNFFLLYRALIKKIGKMDWEDTKAQLVKVIFLSAVMGLSCRFLWNVLLYGKYVKMLIVATLGLFIFIVGGFALRLRHVYYIKEWISKKR
jgi:peptidoglycan biosynthesis protein MviN/MurJ (putative lipid II flippase)